MTTSTTIHAPRHQMTFEDLKGLRAEGYIRDSTLDQRDGFGPDIQRRNEERFAQSYGLLLGDRWYTEFVSGRSVSKRTEFKKLLEDARLDRFDVLLVDHTSRFARNQADCIRYKEELQRSGKIVVFVSQGIISGSDRDFLAERINETLDEAYSRNLARYVSAGYAEKASQGYANRPAPLGYRSDKLASGRRERKVPDPETMPVLKELLRCYASGSYSLQTLADHLNAMAYRTSTGRLFTKTSIEAVLSNRFYEGKAIYHPGRPDEEVRDGIHDVAPEVKDLWRRCQGVRGRRHRSFLAGRPREEQRAYPFARITECSQCGARYGAKYSKTRRGGEVRRLAHSRDHCSLKLRSIPVERLMAQFHDGVLPYVALDKSWQDAVLQAMGRNHDEPSYAEERASIERAMANLRKQHLWGDVTDVDYRVERQALERRLKALAPTRTPVDLPDLERAAGLLTDLPALWSHPGVDDRQREGLVRELLLRVTVAGDRLIGIEPQDTYKPLFAYMVSRGVSNRTPETLPENFNLNRKRVRAVDDPHPDSVEARALWGGFGNTFHERKGFSRYPRSGGGRCCGVVL